MSLASMQSELPDVLKVLAHDLRWNLITALAHGDYRVSDLVRLLNQPINLVSYHLKQLRDQQLVTERRSSADGRDVYYSLDLDTLRAAYIDAGAAIHPLLAGVETLPQPRDEHVDDPPIRVLFLCTQNSARSQMAEGILRQLGGSRVVVASAGSQPSSVHQEAIRALAAMGIDISRQRSKHLDEFRDQSFDYIITVCDRVREACPVFPDDPDRIHWSFPDPAAIEDHAERARAFTRTAQQLVTRVHHLLILIDRKRRG